MDIREHVVALNEKRARAAKQLNDHLDECHNAHPGEVMSEEERAKEQRISDEIDALEDEIRRFVAREEREKTSAELRDAADAVFGPRWSTARTRRPRRRRFPCLGALRRSRLVRVSGFMAEYANLRAQMRDQGLTGRDLRNALYTDTGSLGSAVPTTMAADAVRVHGGDHRHVRAPTTKITTPAPARTGTSRS